MFIARRNPDIGDRTHADIHLVRGSQIAIQPATALHRNTTVGTIEKFLGAAIGQLMM
jgi:hypothetical protein